jgi:hypothetical protein
MGRLGLRVLGISLEETSVRRRRFRCDRAELREHLEEVGRCFVFGYHAALEDGAPGSIAGRLADVTPAWRGFAFEGAALALTVLDTMTPWRRGRLRAFLAGPSDAHAYIVHIGAGWALGRLPLSPAGLLSRLDPVLGWLALDGYGFHQGFFHWPQAVTRKEVPRRLRGYERRAFDQGLGRSLWFVEGTDVERIAGDIAAFPHHRHADLWSGVGLACAYAGGCDRSAVADLRQAAGAFAPMLAQGGAFAAEARARAGNPTAHTAEACEILCGHGLDAAAVARNAGRDLSDLPAGGTEPAFETWRLRIQEHFATLGAVA